MKYCMLIITLLFTSNAIAESPAPIKISSIFVSGANNFHFRVHSNGGWHCYNGPTTPTSWSYINENDDGANGKMAVLLSAYMAGKTVHLVTKGVDIATVGHVCKIVEFSISD